MKAFLLGVAVTLVVAAGMVVTLVSGGYFTIAASAHETSFMRWLLHSVYENTLAVRAADIQVPENLNSPAMIDRGARDFDSMCSPCHTPPGQQRSAIHLGLSPQPPKLIELMDGRTPAEAFWVLDNGIRMTGMPAFGETHDDRQLWQLVAFITDAGTYTARQYEARVPASATADSHDHDHGHFDRSPAPGDQHAPDKHGDELAPPTDDVGNGAPATDDNGAPPRSPTEALEERPQSEDDDQQDQDTTHGAHQH